MSWVSRTNRCNACGEKSSSSSYCTNCGNVFHSSAFSSYENIQKDKFNISSEELDILFPEEKITFTCRPQQDLKKAVIRQRIYNSFVVIMLTVGLSIYQAGTLLNYTTFLITASGGVITVAIFSILYGFTAGKKFHSIYVITDKRAAVVNRKKVIKSWNIHEIVQVGYRFAMIFRIPSYSVFFWKKGVNITEYGSDITKDMKFRTVMRVEKRNRKNRVIIFPFVSEDDAKKVTLDYLKNTVSRPKESSQFGFDN